MAYSKRRYRRRPARRYRRYRRSAASKALYLARKANRSELKYHTVAVNSPMPFTSGQFRVSLSNVIQGTGQNQRIGLSITPTSINVQMLMKLNDLGDLPHTVRVILFLWRAENYTVGTGNPPDQDYLQEPTVTSYKNEQQRFMSKTLYDRAFSLSPNGTRQMRISIKRKLSTLMAYTQDGSYQNRNQLMMLVYTDSNSGNPDPEVTFSTRLYFTDK